MPLKKRSPSTKSTNVFKKIKARLRSKSSKQPSKKPKPSNPHITFFDFECHTNGNHMSPTWREDFEIIMERRWVIPKKGNDQRMAHGMEMMESEERADPWNTEEDEHIESYKEAYERMTQVCVQSRIEGVESW